MTTYLSKVEKRGPITFPSFTGERIYMREFFRGEGLPEDIKRWQSTVDAMLRGVDVSGPLYLMVDQAHVKSGEYHRRPGVHVDGYWNPSLSVHGPPPRHNPKVSDQPEALLLASDVASCRAYGGVWSGEIGEGGDCSGVGLDSLSTIPLEANRVWAGNVSMLHESLPVTADCYRTLVRINVPGWDF